MLFSTYIPAFEWAKLRYLPFLHKLHAKCNGQIMEIAFNSWEN